MPDEAATGPHRTKKRFGQHFLHDRGVIERLLRAIDPQPGERFVEIGPGDGALTFPLLARIGRLTAIELDRDLIPRLRERGGDALELVEADALTVDLTARAASVDGVRAELTAREWALLEALVLRSGRIVDKAELEKLVLGFDSVVASNALEVHVSALRRKLGRALIETVRGLGYRIGQAQ